MSPPTSKSPSPRLTRLLSYLNADPCNTRLIADAATAAFEDGTQDLAAQLIEQYASTAALPPAMVNLKGLIAIASGRYQNAIETFEELRQADDAPALRFNLAWSHAMLDQYHEALILLDDDVLAISPRAPALKIQMMHHLELYDDAMALGKELAARYPENHTLLGSLSTLALDAENSDLAKQYASQAGDNPEAQVTLGVLALGEQDTTKSMAMFEKALAEQPENARAWVGKGLGLMATGDADAGSEALEKGAELFKDHLGSWVAAGWSHFVRGDFAKARASFERAESIDDTFAEIHGGLAVLDVAEGRLEAAKRRTQVALRLDKNCFGAALAKIMMLERGGQHQAATKIRDIALSTPIGPNGQTIAQALVGFGNLRHS
jgi:tetratricopeptide (TPR) repeat protein